MTSDKVTSTTLAFTNDGVLLKYYYAFRNSTPNTLTTSVQFEFPFRIHRMKAKDKEGELQVTPFENILPHTTISVNLRRPVAFGQKQAFKISAFIEPKEGIGKWKETYVMDWGQENLDEIVFIRTNPLFVSGIGQWKRENDSYILTPVRGWKTLVSHTRKGKTIRFEWGKPPKYLLKEEFMLRADTPIDDVKVKFFIPRKTEEQSTRIVKGGCETKMDQSKNLEAEATMEKHGNGEWTYEILYEVSLRKRSPVPSDLGKFSIVAKIGEKFPDLVKETKLLDYSSAEIQELAKAISKDTDDLRKILQLTFEFVNQKIHYSENGERWPASRVLKERVGDCSEFSDLFIAILRCLGIPAFGVLGYVVDLREKSIGYHEWAKVLTGAGWLPFDPTWGYFGSVGISHIEVAHEIHGHDTWYSGFRAQGDLSKAHTETRISLLDGEP